MDRRLLLCASAFALASVVSSPSARAGEYGGRCAVSRTAHADKVSLQLRYEKVKGAARSVWENDHDVPVSSLRGFSTTDLTQPGTHRFTVTTEPGDIVCTAVGGYDGMAGTFDFVPSSAFAAGLRNRGIGLPTPQQQIEFAIDGFSLATVDALLRNGYAKPSIDALVEMRDHGVSAEYAVAVKRLWPSARLSDLVKLRDNGV